MILDMDKIVIIAAWVLAQVFIIAVVHGQSAKSVNSDIPLATETPHFPNHTSSKPENRIQI